MQPSGGAGCVGGGSACNVGSRGACGSMATAAPKVYRELGTPLDIPDDKMGAFAAIASYYACEAKLGPKIVSYVACVSPALLPCKC